ncbi:MAG: GH3 auxin-responsive promoter family protein [Oscillospiraceae bacterium]
MSVKCRILNGICRLAYFGEYARFMSVRNVGQEQEKYLSGLLDRNKNTIYGRKYHFDEIHSYNDFAERVPLTKYEDYEPYIEMICRGEKSVLTAEDVILMELTSGSSGGRKMIPYTPSLKREFQRGIMPWLCDIYGGVKGMDSGKSYWSITPVTQGKSYTECGIPIGFEEDSEYFGRAVQSVMNSLFAVDGSVKFSSDTDSFYLDTAAQLLRCRELTLISVWSPSFLSILCGYIRENAGMLCQNLPPQKREEFLDSVKNNRFDKIFPKLKIISCWTDGSAAEQAEEIKKLFPQVYIQPKGLLATECFVSFPIVGEEGSRLSVRSHFFEFRSLADGKIYTADGLQKGEYEVIVTTGGGFYRYCIGDIIRVLEVYHDAPPRIRFVGRNGVSSDLFGEKLTEEFVRSVLKKLGADGCFCLLAPEGNFYRLYTESRDISGETLDKALCESYHYNYCRQLGQLKCAEVCTITANPQKAYTQKLADDGMRIGDIKPCLLTKKSGWETYFMR